MEPKQAIILNYSMLCEELFDTMKEKTDFMSHFFDREPNLRQDGDLMDIAQEFQTFCIALKRFDKVVNSKFEIVKGNTKL